jgi:tetratricopeptide (TPR) repeat protein
MEAPKAKTAVAGPAGAGLTVMVLGVMLVFFVATGLLTGAYRREKVALATGHFGQGKLLAAGGDYREAAEQFRTALMLSRSPEHALALATALLELGKFAEAEAHLSEVLESDPTNGAANLMNARIATRLGAIGQAETAYRRAIYGQWAPDEQGNRVEARFELAQLLIRTGREEQALGELLELNDEVASNGAQSVRLARLYLRVDAPERAERILAAALEREPDNLDALRALGDAYYRARRYQDAAGAYRKVSEAAPQDETLAERARLTAEMAQIDPYAPRLRTAAALGRAADLVRRALRHLEPCLKDREAAPDALARLLERARAHASARSRAVEQPQETIDTRFAIARELWSATAEYCRDQRPSDPAFEELLARSASR